MWPVMHFCGIATVNCSEFDNAFDQYGVIKRQCTKEGAHSINWASFSTTTLAQFGTQCLVCDLLLELIDISVYIKTKLVWLRPKGLNGLTQLHRITSVV